MATFEVRCFVLDDGSVRQCRASGPPQLQDAVLEAVKAWKFDVSDVPHPLTYIFTVRVYGPVLENGRGSAALDDVRLEALLSAMPHCYVDEYCLSVSDDLTKDLRPSPEFLKRVREATSCPLREADGCGELGEHHSIRLTVHDVHVTGGTARAKVQMLCGVDCGYEAELSLKRNGRNWSVTEQRIVANY